MLEETFTIEVMKGKKKVIGVVTIDAGEGIWPTGEWVPTEPIEDDFELQFPGKNKKYEGTMGTVTVSYLYAGASENALELFLRVPHRVLPSVHMLTRNVLLTS